MALYERWNGAEGPALQAKADRVRKIFQSPNMIPAMKRAAAEFSGHRDWALVRPPLAKLDESAAASLLRELQAAGFSMPGFAEAMR